MYNLDLVIGKLLRTDNIANVNKILDDLTDNRYYDLVLEKIVDSSPTSSVIVFRGVRCSLCAKFYLAYNCIMKYNVKCPDRYYCSVCEVMLPWYLKGDINIELLFK